MTANVWGYRGQLEINTSASSDTSVLEQRRRVAMFRVLLYIIIGLIWNWNTRLMFCWPCITVHQYSEINVIYFLSNLLGINSLYMFRHYLPILTSILVQQTNITRTQYFIYIYKGFDGLVVRLLASGTQDRGFSPGRSRGIFRAKISSACLSSEGK
jgi:hypothetical protein